ncbi:MAG: hypothetical protein OSB68_06930 [Dehalococcoidia bacterium]|nr:hypothetical protein [Dehalococcoidia bacterium]
MSSSVRDILITAWSIICVITVGVIAFHPSFKYEGLSMTLSISGFALIATVAGVTLARFTEILGCSSQKMKTSALVIFVVCMLPLIPVGLATFSMPWAALIIATLVYVRWKWAVTSPAK